MDLRQGARDLHGADHRRRAGDGDPGADDFDFGRPDRDARELRGAAGGGVPQADSSATRSRCLLAGGVLIALAALPGMPTLPFLLLGGGPAAPAGRCEEGSGAGRRAGRGSRQAGRQQGKPGNAAARGTAGHRGGPGAGRPGGGRAGIAAAAPISAIRRQLASDLGYLLAPVRVTDNLALRSREYVISLKGRGDRALRTAAGLRAGDPDGGSERPIEGQATREPAFGMNAFWMPAEQAERARHCGLHGGGRGERAGHASGRTDPAPRPRTVLAAGRQEAAGPRGGGAPQGGRGPGAQTAAAGHCAAGAAEPAARAGVDSRRGIDSGSAGRGGRIDAQSGAADRIRPPGASGGRW